MGNTVANAPRGHENPFPWWEESMRGRLIGYGTKNGNTRVHLMQSDVSGPGAVSWHALCGELQGIGFTDSGLIGSDENECRRFWMSRVQWMPSESIDYQSLGGKLRSACPRCVAKHEKRLEKIAA